jgi:hypothetical protein
MYSMFVLAAFLVLAFGAIELKNLSFAKENLESLNLEDTLGNAIKRQSMRSFGSIEEKSIALPYNMEGVCFVDRKKEISSLVNLELMGEVRKYENKNVFFEPFDEFSPIDVKNFELTDNPLCVKSVGGVARISITSKGNRSLVAASNPSETESDCISVLYNGDNGIDIVFLPYRYEKPGEFAEDVNKYIGVFLDTNPFASNKGKMNFYRIDDFEGIDCEVGAWVKCDEFGVKKAASSCPHDYIIVLVKRGAVEDLVSPVRSSAIGNIEKINTAEPNKVVVLHEFGHSFGGLADEYVDERYYGGMNFNPTDYPNCDYPSCSRWRNFIGAGCYEGCSLGGYSRAAESSIMKTLDSSDFGLWNEDILQEKLNKYEDG